jgi:hypothetical protein
LTPTIEASGPHDFAVRKKSALVSSAPRVHRIPRPTSVTIAKRPSCGRGIAIVVEVIWVKSEPEYFCEKGWTGQSVICPSGAINCAKQTD